MSYQGPMLIREPQLRWPIVLLAATITAAIALLIAGLQYLVMTQPYSNPGPVTRLQQSLRSGDLEFEQFRKQIVIGRLVGTEKMYPFNNLSVALTATITNTTGRTITGLELRGAILDSKGSVTRERTVVVVPTHQTALERDEAMNVRILLERIKPSSERDHILMEVTALRVD